MSSTMMSPYFWDMRTQRERVRWCVRHGIPLETAKGMAEWHWDELGDANRSALIEADREERLDILECCLCPRILEPDHFLPWCEDCQADLGLDLRPTTSEPTT
jgi:hypothetical protein